MTESSTALRIVGPARLVGEVSVTGAKNSALKLMAASLLAPGKNTLRNIPDIADVGIMSELLRRLGCVVDFDPATNVMTIEVPQTPGHIAEYDLVRKMRASINVLGPLLTRVHQAEISLPGGDAIGSRGLDFHIAGLEAMGAVITFEHGFIIATAPEGLHGAEIETYNDHRMAMCFAVLGLKVPGIKLKNPACVKKTFPNFFQKLAAPPPHGLGAEIWEIKNGQRTRRLNGDDLFAD